MSVTHRRAVLLVVVVVAVVGVAALLATGLRRDPTATASPLVGRDAPDFALRGLNGPDVRLSTLRGHVVVVNFWASWCAECRTEQAALDDTWQRFRDSGVVVLGVDFQDTTGDAREFLDTAAVTYPTVQDTDSRVALAYGLRGVPETFVVDQRGRIVDRIIGAADADRLANTIGPLLAGGAS